jgi:hypothetical protein
LRTSVPWRAIPQDPDSAVPVQLAGLLLVNNAALIDDEGHDAGGFTMDH